MRFSKIYIQENFIPDIATDPYGRKVIGIEVTLNDDDKIEQAKDLAEQYVKEYIQSNKIESPHIQEQSLPPEPTILPEIQVDKQEDRVQSLIRDIEFCEDMTNLSSFCFIVKGHPELEEVYNRKFNEIISKKTK